MAGWIERLRGRLTGRPADAAARRIEAALAARGEHASFEGWLEAVLAALPAKVDGHALARIALTTSAPGLELVGDDGAALLRFWAGLVGRADEPAPALAYHADAELRVGEPRRALERFLDAFEAEPSLWFDFAEDLAELAEREGGELLFRWQLVALRAVLADVPEDDEWIRERYSELLDVYRDQPERLVRLYPIGEEIRRLESSGALPRAMVVRAPRPPRRR